MLLTNKMTQNCMFTTTWHNHFDMLEVKPTYHKSNVCCLIFHIFGSFQSNTDEMWKWRLQRPFDKQLNVNQTDHNWKVHSVVWCDQRSSETYRNGMARLMIDGCRLLQRTLHMITYKNSFDLRNKMQTNVA